MLQETITLHIKLWHSSRGTWQKDEAQAAFRNEWATPMLLKQFKVLKFREREMPRPTSW